MRKLPKYLKHPSKQAPFDNQKGAAMMIFIIILVMGITTALVSSLNSASVLSLRQNSTSTALSQAKEALISYAVIDTNRPGELPCPSTDADGVGNYSGGGCANYVGFLPWKDLGLPELRDGSGTPLWYALSSNFYSGGSSILNSDTLGALSITGTTNISNIAAIVIAPGAPLCNQSRSTTTISNFLESLDSVSTTTAISRDTNINCAVAPQHNDQLLAITADQIFQPVEKRIAREAKSCLDSYADASGGKYPWAAAVDNNWITPSVRDKSFGRFPDGIKTSDINSDTQSFINSLNNLQSNLNDYVLAANSGTPSSTIRDALEQAGETLKDIASPLPSQLFSGAGTQATYAGNKAKNLSNNPPTNSATASQVQAYIDATQAWVYSSLIANASNSNFDNCLLLRANGTSPVAPAPYWATWKNMLFYHVATGSTSNNGVCSTCITLGNGTSTNRAVVIVAGRKKGTNRNPSTTSDYLEADNLLPSNNLSNPYKTYRATDSSYQNINDVILCIDGQVNCK